MTRFAGSLVARVIGDAFASRARRFVAVAPRFGIDPVVRRSRFGLKVLVDRGASIDATTSVGKLVFGIFQRIMLQSGKL